VKDVWIKKIGEHRGNPRIYLDGLQAVRAGFSPGERFDLVVDEEGKKVVISKNADGSRVVSAKTKGEVRQPVIDINSGELLAMFEGMDSIRVVVGEDCVYLLPLASELKRRERLERLATKLGSGEPLAIGSLAHGGGILSNAIHKGLQDAGIECELAFANEIRDDLITHAAEHNYAWSEKTGAVAVPMQELVQDDWLMDHLPKLEILEAGQPCSGASKAGKANRGASLTESHPEVGHLVFSTLAIIAKTQPAAVLIECVTEYAVSASAEILRFQLRDAGYDVHEAVLEGQDFGSLENRIRWCCVAVTRGIEFSFDRLAPAVRVVKQVREVLDPIPPDHPMWRPVTYLKEKRERDEAKGSRFLMQYVYEDSTSVPTIRKAYQKGGSSDPRLVHPTNPELSRLFTEGEIARIKGIDPALIEGLSRSVATQIMGQGIVYEPFRAAGQRIGEALRNAVAAWREGRPAQADSEVGRRRQRMTG
jgi:DNA (cytosine-5)-methyltransferase 1